MGDFLVNYAINNFWCNPTQNNSVIFNLARLTPATGAMNYYSVLERTMPLPTNSEYYHLFQIGQMNPSFIGLIEQSPEWTYDSWQPIYNAINNLSTFIHIYNELGIEIPKTDVFYRYTRNRDLILAVRYNLNIPVLYGSENIYIRLYSNAYFQLSSSAGEALVYNGATVTNTTEILNLQTIYNTYASMPGYTFVHVNGILVDILDMINVSLGDTVEFIYDPSVKRVLTLPVNSLQVYDSVLDSTNKYLIHDALANNDTINYVDNIDVYISNPWATNRFQSIYYNKNNVNSHRMITHRDFGIVVSYFVHQATSFQNLSSKQITDINNLNIQVFIRKSGFNHSLVFENNRIGELYKLSDTAVIGAMVGVNSVLANWQAPTLENSPYTAVMSMYQNQITDLVVQNALGYNAYSKVVADTPSPSISSSGQLVAYVPSGLQNNYTAYEYNSSGVMLGYGQGNAGDTYNIKNANTAYVEMLYGESGSTPSVFYTESTVVIPNNCNYRVYSSYTTTTGIIGSPWEDITGSNQYAVSVTAGGTVISLSNTTSGQVLMIRTDIGLLNYDINMVPVDGVLEFTFSENGSMPNKISPYQLPVPMSDLDIFLNGYSLIEGIDYIVNFPNVVIINKEYLAQPADVTSQYIHVRWNGFCNSNLTYNSAVDTGFIADSAFSNNYKYDVMDDSVCRFIVGGRYLTREQIGINDTEAGVSVNSSLNGQPYCLKKPMVPIQGLIGTDLLSFISASKAIDAGVQNYLDEYLTKLSEPLMSIPAQYTVVSPFIVKILYLLKNGNIPYSMFSPTMTDNDIINICKPYEGLLAYDPITLANTIDPRFAVIAPSILNTTVSLLQWQYSFLLRVVGLYAKNSVDLSAYITISLT